MLKRLMEFGIQEKFFDIKPLGELPKSCCTESKVDVIDFDRTKEIISKICGLQQPKSADALKILPDLNRIDFIELKGFQQFIKHFDKQSKGHSQPDETIKNQIVDFNLSEKIHDSLFILNSLIHHKDFKRTQSLAKLLFLQALHSALGEQKIDVVLRLANKTSLPIYQIAKETGIQLQ
jgi:hypothetical protein